VENHDEVRLLIPPRSCHRRIVRLVAAEAGERAGFDVSELDDLWTVVDELVQLLIGAADAGVLLQVGVDGGQVSVRGSGHRAPDSPAPQIPAVSELMMDAVTDRYLLDDVAGAMSFLVVKQAARVPR
jgi:hypothetical protein